MIQADASDRGIRAESRAIPQDNDAEDRQRNDAAGENDEHRRVDAEQFRNGRDHTGLPLSSDAERRNYRPNLLATPNTTRAARKAPIRMTTLGSAVSSSLNAVTARNSVRPQRVAQTIEHGAPPIPAAQVSRSRTGLAVGLERRRFPSARDRDRTGWPAKKDPGSASSAGVRGAGSREDGERPADSVQREHCTDRSAQR